MMHHPSFNIGIEEEYQLIDPVSLELLGYSSPPYPSDRPGKLVTDMQIDPQHPDFAFASRLSGSVLEAGTPVCADIGEAREQLQRLRNRVLELGHAHGFRVAAAGTHPFSHWQEGDIAVPRFRRIAGDGRIMVQRMLAFSLNIHIGIEDRELSVDVMNTMRYLLPHILCLTTSSPFCFGNLTGLKSYRLVLLREIPRTGIPGVFENYQEYSTYTDMLVRTRSIPDAGAIMFDIMPHHRLPTLVIRTCDMMPNYQDTLAVVALVQAVAAWMVTLRYNNMSFRRYPRIAINENIFRAIRYGLEGRLIDLGIEKEMPVHILIGELLERIAPLAEQLGSQREIEHIQTILERGSSADQQLATWQSSGEDLQAVTKHIIAETERV